MTDETSISPSVPPAAGAPLQGPVGSLPDAVTMLKGAWEMFKPRIWNFLGIMGLVYVACMAVGALIAILVVLGIVIARPDTSDIGRMAVTYSLLGLPVMLLFVFISAWGGTAMITAAVRHKEKLGVIEVYRQSLKQVLSMFWIQILLSLVIMVGFILFVIPGFIFIVWLTFAPFILISEGVKGSKALSKSREYVKGRWWYVLWKLVVLYLVMTAGWIVLVVIGDVTKAPTLSGVLSMAFSLLMGPYSVCYLYVLYQHLRATTVPTKA